MLMMTWLLLLVLAFLPPLVYMVWIRNTEKYDREKWKPILLSFLWGATIAIIASIFLELLLGNYFKTSLADEGILLFSLPVVIAPFAEELTKPLALRLKTVKKELVELEDGLIYGAVAGLGFSATENLFYGVSFLSRGLTVFLVLMAMRSVGACLLHASATAWTGYGYGKTVLRHTSFLRVLPYFVLAMLIHASYNFLVTYEILGAAIGFIAALLFSVWTIQVVRNKIMTLDGRNQTN